MQTKVLKINSNLTEKDKEKILEAAHIIRDAGLVAFPTETVYGLGGNALDPVAVKKIYEAKGRPSDNPMIVHIGRASDIGQLTPRLSPDIVALIEHFWPGPLTLVVEKKESVPAETTGGLNTVAVRMPDSQVALELINESGVPIAAPSANLSGKPSPTKGCHVIDDLEGKVDAILIGEDCRVGIESTVLDVTTSTPVILRPGIITREDIEIAISKRVEFHPSLGKNSEEDVDLPNTQYSGEFIPKSPGMKYKHYAPEAQMIVIEGQREKVKSEIERLKKLNEKLGNNVGVILFEEKAFIEAAQTFFSKLRDMDRENVDLILAGALSDTDGVGFAVMNRMLKSAGYNIVKV